MTSRSALLIALLISASLPAHAQNGFQFLDDEAEAGGYDVTAQLTKTPVDWWLAKQEDGSGYRVTVDGKTILLSIQRGNKITPLATAAFNAAGGTNFVAQRRGPQWNFLLNGQTVLRAEDDSFAEGQIGFRGAVKDARVQPIESIAFDDDFMRVAADVALAQAKQNPRQGVRIRDAQLAEDIWTPVAGSWQTTGLTENAEAQVAQSANPFAFRPAAQGTNIALSGRPFWTDYTAAVSLKPEGASSIGLLIYAQDAKNYLGLVWPSDGEPMLRAMVNGSPRILGRAQGVGPFENKQWYRLRVSVAGGLLQGFIDDQEVVRARTGLFGRGQVGLFTESKSATDTAAFDDVSVRSLTDFHDDFSQPVPGRWRTISGNWNFQGAAKPVGKSGAFAVMGEPDWTDYTVSADLTLPSDGATGLVLHHVPGQGAYLLRVAGSKSKLPYAGKVQILKVAGGKNQVLGESNAGSRWDGKTMHWRFSSERGYLKALVGADLENLARAADAFDNTLAGGRAGVYAQAGSANVPATNNFAVEFLTARPTWAKVPDLYELEQQAQTMGGWSTPQGFWVPVSSGAGTPRTLKHKGSFWGDDTLRFLLPDLTEGKTMRLEFETAAKRNLALILSDSGGLKAEVNNGSVVGTGTAKFDTLKDLPIEVQRRGSYIIVRAGAKDAQKLVLAVKAA